MERIFYFFSRKHVMPSYVASELCIETRLLSFEQCFMVHTNILF